MARDRPVHADRVGLLRAGADPASPGPSGRGRPDLSAGSEQPGHVRSATASRWAEPTWAWPRSPTSGTKSSTFALRHATEGIALCRQLVYAAPLATGLAHTLAMIRQATSDPARALKAITEAGQASSRPAKLAQSGPGAASRGCCWPKVTCLARPVVAQDNGARPGRRAEIALANPATWSWPGSCSRRPGPARRSRCWTGSTRPRPPRTGPTPSSRRVRCAGAGAGG